MILLVLLGVLISGICLGGGIGFLIGLEMSTKWYEKNRGRVNG